MLSAILPHPNDCLPVAAAGKGGGLGGNRSREIRKNRGEGFPADIRILTEIVQLVTRYLQGFYLAVLHVPEPHQPERDKNGWEKNPVAFPGQ